MTFEYEKHIPSRAEIVFGMAADGWRRWRDRRDLTQFLENYPTEANRVARDLNIDPASLMAVVGHGRAQPSYLKRRLHALGIDLEEVHRTKPAVAQDLARCCTLCSAKTRCARDLVRRTRGADWRTYCPNEQTIEALHAEKSAFFVRGADRRRRSA